LTLTICLATEYEGVLKDPVALGAWLYKSTCTRCHGSYASSRAALNFESREELRAALSGDGCEVDWSRSGGGPFKRQELDGLVSYMLKWESLEEEPSLPELPELLVEEAEEIAPPQADRQESSPGEEETEPVLADELVHLLASNTIARGGYLYTQNCYRCHLSYDKARLGKGMAPEALQLIISEGKTSTQMKPFSTMLGGNLKNSEIKAVAKYIVTAEKAGEPLAIAPVLMIPPALDPADFLPLRLTRFRQITGDSKKGEKIYQISCRKCHGSRGEGYVGPSLRETKPVLRPDLFLKSVLKQGIPGSLMVSWDSSKGGSLSAKDLDDLISYITLWEHQGDTGIAYHSGMTDCAICHRRPADHRQGKCVFCHDTVEWAHAS
jgi:mono/diheme cytochrome c family protein